MVFYNFSLKYSYCIHYFWITLCLCEAGFHGSGPGLSDRAHRHAGTAAEWSNGAGSWGDPGRTAVCHPASPGPSRTGEQENLLADRSDFLSLTDSTLMIRYAWSQISTIAESEDSQESVDSVTDTQKRREILSRRPSYRFRLFCSPYCLKALGFFVVIIR